MRDEELVAALRSRRSSILNALSVCRHMINKRPDAMPGLLILERELKAIADALDDDARMTEVDKRS